MEERNSGFEQLSVSNLIEVIQTFLSDQSTLEEEMKRNLRNQLEINDRIRLLIKRMRPLGNDDDLDRMDFTIAANSKFRKVLVDDLISIGGNDINDMVIRLMKKLFTMELLSGYSWKGYINKSRPFKKLNIYGVIFDAVKEKFSDSLETQKFFESAIQIHLNKAPRRSL